MRIESVAKLRERNAKYGGAWALPQGTDMKEMVEEALRDQIVELEEKIYQGNLGNLKVVTSVFHLFDIVHK